MRIHHALRRLGAVVSIGAWLLAVGGLALALSSAQGAGSDRPSFDTLAWVAVAGLAAAGVLLMVLIFQMRSRSAALHELNRTLEHLAHVDPLTRLRNRRAIEQLLHAELSAARRHEHPVSVLLLDVDHFKSINDTYGHHGGDRALQEIGETLERNLRAEDALGRWGGEEFLAVLRFTDELGARDVAERLRRAVATSGVLEHPVTVTIGVAQWDGESLDELLAAADRALYAGKLAGRDTVRPASATLTVAPSVSAA